MPRLSDGIYLLARRSGQGAAMLGVSESQLHLWVSEGKIHPPYRLRKNVVLFDAVTLAADWDRMKQHAHAELPMIAADEPEEEPNPWDEALR